MRAYQRIGVAVAAAAACGGCSIVDDEPPPTGTGGTGDDVSACSGLLAELLRNGCPPHSYPRVHYDGGSSTVLQLDDPNIATALGLGMLVQFGAKSGADWVGYNITQTGDCTAGCFVPGCSSGDYGCYATNPSGDLCSFWCDDIQDADACTDLAATCLGDDDAGETEGEVVAPYDCDGWHPESVQSMDGIHVVPRSLVDMLERNDVGPLIQCDQVRVRQGSGGYWAISRMAEGGLLARLGLQVGDELHSFDGVDLASIDDVMMAASAVSSDDGPFALGVRRQHSDVDLLFRIVAAEME